MTAGVLGMTCGAMLVFFLAVDLLWLGVVARRFYLKHLGRFFAERVNWATAFVFYLIWKNQEEATRLKFSIYWKMLCVNVAGPTTRRG
jgi:uncharacterized membrane protein